MALEKIYVVRHGFRSSWSVNHKTGVYTGMPSPTGIAADPALTSYGIDQSRELARHLMTLEPPVDKVYSSPFYRCLETMQPFVQLRGDLKMLPEHGIREWFGSAPFEHPEPAEPAVLKTLFPTYDEAYVSAARPTPKGETLDQLQRRVSTALTAIVEQCDADGTKAVVLCSHAAVIIIIGRILTGRFPDTVEADDFLAYTCGLSVYTRRGQQDVHARHQLTPDDRYRRSSTSSGPDSAHNVVGGWDCQLNSDCSFLSGGQERGWRFAGDESFPDTGNLSQTVGDYKL